MRCPNCSRETPSNQPWCVHCGKKVVVTGDQAFAQARAQAQLEREKHTAARVRRLLGYAVAAFVVSMVLFIATRNPPTPRLRPWPGGNPPPAMIEGSTPWENAPAGVSRSLVEMRDEDEWDELPLLVPADNN